MSPIFGPGAQPHEWIGKERKRREVDHVISSAERPEEHEDEACVVELGEEIHSDDARRGIREVAEPSSCDFAQPCLEDAALRGKVDFVDVVPNVAMRNHDALGVARRSCGEQKYVSSEGDENGFDYQPEVNCRKAMASGSASSMLYEGSAPRTAEGMPEPGAAWIGGTTTDECC